MKPSVIDGKTWGLPVAASARAMYYNKDLLAKAGVNEPPATWDELEADAKKVKALGGNVYGFGLQGKEIETDAYWYYALWSEGGELLSGGKSGIASNSGIKAATMYKRFIDEGITQSGVTDYNRQDIEALFKQGRVAMILSGPWLRGQIATEAPKLNYSLAAIPKGTTQATYGVTDSIMMFKTSKVKKEAWQFLEEFGLLRQGPQGVHPQGGLPAGPQVGRGGSALRERPAAQGVHEHAALCPLRAADPELGADGRHDRGGAPEDLSRPDGADAGSRGGRPEDRRPDPAVGLPCRPPRKGGRPGPQIRSRTGESAWTGVWHPSC